MQAAIGKDEGFSARRHLGQAQLYGEGSATPKMSVPRTFGNDPNEFLVVRRVGKER